jgi:glutamine synthetase
MLQNQYCDKLWDLDQNGNTIAEYIWIDGTGLNVRSKCRTIPGKITKISDCPEWNYDGSSTYQAVTDESEIILRPIALYRDPFRRGDNVLVLCETFNWKNKECKELIPSNTNFRHFAMKVWLNPQVAEEKTWYGIE